ncbi:hypothetical protein LUZ60_012239 [Juncus effusus]|nr:hypothetical protein LUZ60_012239 [Juncus effusus]
MALNKKERAKLAVEAMLVFGFSKKLIANVLKHLLTVYEGNWELIEDDSYQVLLDAIMEAQANGNNGGTVENPEPNSNRAQEGQFQAQLTPISSSGPHGPDPSSSKRHRRDLASASSAQEDETDREETETEPQTDLLLRKRSRRTEMPHQQQQTDDVATVLAPAQHQTDDVAIVVVPAQHQNDDRAIVVAPAQHLSVADPAHQENNTSIDPQSGQIITYQRSSKNKNKRKSNGIVLREPKFESENEDQPLAMILPNSENQANQERETPPTIITNTPPTSQNPNPNSNTSTSLNPNPNSNTPSTSQNPNPNSSSSADVASVPDHTGTVQLGSSSNGQVNLVFQFPSQNPNFPSPNLDEFFHRVENQCLRSFRSINPNFSLPNFFNDMCQMLAEQFRTSTGTDTETGTESPTVPVDPTENGTGTQLVPNPNLDLGEIRPAHDLTDICKGLERLAIPILNQCNSDTCPSQFNYISTNFAYQNAYLHFTLARIGDQNCCADCFGNCISNPIPCSCATNSNGEFRYNNEGILKKEFLDECVGLNWDKDLKKNRVYCEGLECKFEIEGLECKGHFERKFIKECFIKCGCNMQCMNRVVQRGIMCRLQVFMTSDGRGWGLQTLDEIPKGTFVCKFVGEILTKSELSKRYEQNKNYGKNVNIVKLDASCQGQEGQEGLFLDPTFYGNVSRFVNHRCCDANLVEIPVEIESPDHHYYHVALFTTRKIEAFEELTWDYGIDFTESENSVKGFECKCGSKYCRNIQRSRKRGRKN